MNTGNMQISPVDVAERKELGIKSGDTVRVWQKIEEKGKTRLQAFEGVVLATKHGSEPGATFTVRKVSLGVGVEKVFPLYSPMIDKIEILKRARVRKSKLYFVRDKVTRELRRIFRKSEDVNIATKGAAELEEERKRAEEELKRQQEEEAKRLEEEQKAQEESDVADVQEDTENDSQESDSSEESDQDKEDAKDNSDTQSEEIKDTEEESESEDAQEDTSEAKKED